MTDYQSFMLQVLPSLLEKQELTQIPNFTKTIQCLNSVSKVGSRVKKLCQTTAVIIIKMS